MTKNIKNAFRSRADRPDPKAIGVNDKVKVGQQAAQNVTTFGSV